MEKKFNVGMGTGFMGGGLSGLLYMLGLPGYHEG